MPRSNYFDKACAEAGLTFRLVRSTWVAASQGNAEAKRSIANWRQGHPKLLTVFNLMERIDNSQRAAIVGKPKKQKSVSTLVRLKEESNAKGSTFPLPGGAPGLGKRR